MGWFPLCLVLKIMRPEMRLGCGFCADQDHEADDRDADDIGNLISAVRYMG